MYRLTLPPGPHRFAPLLQDMPVLADGQPISLDEQQRHRMGHFLEWVGLRRTEKPKIERWPPPRGRTMLGNSGIWVPIGTPQPLEMKLPYPDDLTPEGRQTYRDWLDQFDD